MVHSLIMPMDKYILGKCTKVVAISEKMKDYLVVTRNISKEKVSVVINWQDESEFLNYQKTAKPEVELPFTFMYMGNIGPVAGVDLLIEAFTQAGLNNARLVVAGSGSMKEKMQEKATANKNIEFWDVPNGKVPEIQAKADCMLLPIKKGAASSSIPSKLPAYMFSAKPIIGCMDDDSDTANAIKDAGCGWVIEPENARLLSEKMRTVAVLDAAYLNAYGEKALKYGLEHFSKSENLRKLTEVIESVVE
jgi:glycosyltransferase involved in cell wall biosynthesis